jgi:hypothetical protein
MMIGKGAEIDFQGQTLELYLLRFETFRPKEGHGTLGKFDVSIPGILEIRNFKLRKTAEGKLRLVTARLERDGGFSVEIRKWLGKKILQMAIEKLREIARNDLAVLDADVKAEDVTPSYVPGLDVAALPAQLMRAVR